MFNCKTKLKTNCKVCFPRKCQNREKIKSVIFIHLQSANRKKERSRIQIAMRYVSSHLSKPWSMSSNIFFYPLVYSFFLNASFIFKFRIHLYLFFSLFSNKIIYEINSQVDFKCVLAPFAITRLNFNHFIHQEIENLNFKCSQTFRIYVSVSL